MPLYNIPAEQSSGEKIASIVSRLFGGYMKGQTEAKEEEREAQKFPLELANLQARTGQAQRAGRPKVRTLQNVQKEIDDILTTLKKDEGLLKGGLDESVIGMLKEQQGRLYKEMAGFLGGQYQLSQPATDPRWWRFDPDTPAKFQPFGETPAPVPAPSAAPGLPGAAAAGVDWLGGATEPLQEKATGSLAEVAGGLPEGGGAGPGVLKKLISLLHNVGYKSYGSKPAKKKTDTSKRTELKSRGWTDAQIDAALRGK